jgi:hypothetical protein
MLHFKAPRYSGGGLQNAALIIGTGGTLTHSPEFSCPTPQTSDSSRISACPKTPPE